jgi:hypothetical protein
VGPAAVPGGSPTAEENDGGSHDEKDEKQFHALRVPAVGAGQT